ncbi:MAG: sigma-70 family RNA polymerase sigma factor [Bryobacteraceae bacterium]
MPEASLHTHEITRLLNEVRSGNSTCAGRLMNLVYSDLRGVARSYMSRERVDHTLQPTALVHEAYIRVFEGAPVTWQDRIHFFAVAASQMRRVLVDHARQHRAEKRGGGLNVSLDENLAAAPAISGNVELIDDLLHRLERTDPDAARVVELKFFSGLADREVAETLGVSHSTVRRHWAFARAWLVRQLASGQSSEKSG